VSSTSAMMSSSIDDSRARYGTIYIGYCFDNPKIADIHPAAQFASQKPRVRAAGASD
jgi:hypothetical protein